ncbi:ribonuclease Z [Nitzschia inconspicua]|uniref:Ribonuclease Z n=1 Tax=Nitzschia inconspicua TaxID=303405 RepID=A0A9K3KDN5_9STRA|nr:ribonuclease Z [Nitzschia inconspicua]
MAARKSCTHMTWAEAKAKSGFGGNNNNKSGKVKPPPIKDHAKLLAAKIVAKHQNNNNNNSGSVNSEENVITGRQAARLARKDKERQEHLDKIRQAEKEQQRLNDIVYPHLLALEKLDELAEQCRNESSSSSNSNSSNDGTGSPNKDPNQWWKEICESKQMQLDELIALEAIYADTNALVVHSMDRMESLQHKLEEWQSDPDDTEKQMAVVHHPPISFTLKRSYEDPQNEDIVAHMLFRIEFLPDYPLHTTPPTIEVIWFTLISKSLTVPSNKPLEGTNMGTLKKDALKQALTQQAQELVGMPSIYEVLDTYLSENVFDFIERSVSPPKKLRRHAPRIFYTLDVVTDGSEYTGHGTLFLSVWKSSPSFLLSSTAAASVPLQNDFNLLNDSTLLARYAVAGVGDALARLCADQRFKVAPTRACFVPTHSNCLDGLSSLFLALHGAGSSSLHVVLPPATSNIDIVEELASITLGSYKRVDIRTCQLQPPKEDELTFPWWKVYEDEFADVHACCCMEQTSDSWSIILLYSIISSNSSLDDEQAVTTTIAILPPNISNIVEVFQKQLSDHTSLPLVRGTAITSISHVVALNPACHRQAVEDLSKDHPLTNFMVTAPQTERMDRGLFIRSQQLARYFYDGIPWAFVATPERTSSYSSPSNKSNANVTILESTTSCIINSKNEDGTITVIDRRKDIADGDLKEEWASTLESLRQFVPRSRPDNDDNEIVLDDMDDSDAGEDDAPIDSVYGLDIPRLLVLGTGCATPSPHRNASSYALIFPGQHFPQIFILDCGEGASAMLLRSCDKTLDWQRHIRGIWISHAHLDHYGGLPCLLRLLYDARVRNNKAGATKNTEPVFKRQRRELNQECCIPWVMAPPKVLRYLDISLDCHNGRLRDTRGIRSNDFRQVFHPRVHNDPTLATIPPPGPWVHFENVPVHHNCCPSYALLLGWRDGSPNMHRYLCYSGDTRPCVALVRACRNAIGRGRSSSLTLIHEATFSDQDMENAEKKKHSTLGEAVQVASDIPASKLLLTHFSQRYVSLDTNDYARSTLPMGLAADGLWLPMN